MMAMDDDSVLVFDFIKQMTVEERKGITDGDGSELTCMHSIDLSDGKSKTDSSGQV